MNLPNKLTLLRIVLVPVFMLFLLSDMKYGVEIGLVIFIIASFTDFLDGYLARKHKLVTKFGKFMDPLADKLLVSAALISLQYMDRLSPWVVIIIIAREFAITGFRTLAASDGITIAASNWGKIKTNTQMFAIIALMIHRTPMLENILVIAAVVFTIISGVDYIYKNKQVFDNSNK